jgi:hypothetical protein
VEWINIAEDLVREEYAMHYENKDKSSEEENNKKDDQSEKVTTHSL